MAYNLNLADRVRSYLGSTREKIEEKKMFSGLTFMVNDKMCICISEENLMCRFDPRRQEEVLGKIGVQPMIMKEKQLRGYCYVNPEGFKTKKDFDFWLQLCLDFNKKAKSSKQAANIQNTTGS